MSSFLEQRAMPLGTTFLQQKEALFLSSEPAALRKSWALHKFAPSRLRRHHSIGGFIPYVLAELPAPKPASPEKVVARLAYEEEASQADSEVLLDLWPDTDSDREDICSAGDRSISSAAFPRVGKAATYNAACSQEPAETDLSLSSESAAQPPMLQLRSKFYSGGSVPDSAESDASCRTSSACIQPPVLQLSGCIQAPMLQPDASMRSMGTYEHPSFHTGFPQGASEPDTSSRSTGSGQVLQLSLASAVAYCPQDTLSTSISISPSWQGISPCDVRHAAWPLASMDSLPAMSPTAWEARQHQIAQDSASVDRQSSNGRSTEGESETITTLMIRNLPASITQALLLEELDRSGFNDLYDFAYMPMSFDAKTGKGYAFVNFFSQAAAGMFVGSWHESRRCGARGAPLNISPAAIQGLEANIRKWAGPRMARIRNPALRPFIRSTSEVPAWGRPSSKTSAPQRASIPQRTVAAGLACASIR